eukprot:3093716-Prymnesium_polylepis.1
MAQRMGDAATPTHAWQSTRVRVAPLPVLEVLALPAAKVVDVAVESEERRCHVVGKVGDAALQLHPEQPLVAFVPVAGAVGPMLGLVGKLQRVLRHRPVLVPPPVEARWLGRMALRVRLRVPHLAEEVRGVAQHQSALSRVKRARDVNRRRRWKGHERLRLRLTRHNGKRDAGNVMAVEVVRRALAVASGVGTHERAWQDGTAAPSPRRTPV